MDFGVIIELISTVGFPIALVLILGLFVFRIYTDTTKSGKEREEKLYIEIAENRKINERAIETIALYADKLDTIQEDVAEIKKDIIILTNK
jgi:hypothetical protein